MKVLSFGEALSHAERPTHVLLGNGFSRALRNDIFAYDALFDRADFASLSSFARSAFSALGTTDFEVVMRGLREAAALVETYSPTSAGLVERLRQDATGLREVLVQAVAGSHPDRPSDISQAAYSACKRFLARFERIYTLNYDLLLYWTLMQAEIEPSVACDDGFRTPDGGPAEYVSWEPENALRQNIYYLHGALHVFDGGHEIQKFTWINTRVTLIEQIRAALAADKYPLFVAEGQSQDKLERIRHSDFLSKAYRSFSQIGGCLFIHGHSLAENDEHFLRLIEKGKTRQVFISLFGPPDSPGNARIVRRAGQIAAARPGKRPLQVQFYDAASADVWGKS